MTDAISTTSQEVRANTEFNQLSATINGIENGKVSLGDGDTQLNKELNDIYGNHDDGLIKGKFASLTNGKGLNVVNENLKGFPNLTLTPEDPTGKVTDITFTRNNDSNPNTPKVTIDLDEKDFRISTVKADADFQSQEAIHTKLIDPIIQTVDDYAFNGASAKKTEADLTAELKNLKAAGIDLNDPKNQGLFSTNDFVSVTPLQNGFGISADNETANRILVDGKTGAVTAESTHLALKTIGKDTAIGLGSGALLGSAGGPLGAAAGGVIGGAIGFGGGLMEWASKGTAIQEDWTHYSLYKE